MTTQELLNRLRARFGAQSDYAVSKAMGWSRARMSSYRTGRSSFDDETAIQVAETLGIDPGEVLAWMQAERTNCPAAKQAWEVVAARLSTAAMVLIVLGVYVPDVDMVAAFAPLLAIDPLYIIRN